jgi:hypothetical protein
VAAGSSVGEEKTSVTFEDFLALLRTTEVGTQADLNLLDQVIALWEESRVVLTPGQAAEMLALSAPQLEALLDAECFVGASRDSQGQWQLPLDAVLAQHEKQSSPRTQNEAT